MDNTLPKKLQPVLRRGYALNNSFLYAARHASFSGHLPQFVGEYLRPAGNPGGSLPFVHAGFSDGSGESVDLPHGWAIKGPFYVSEGIIEPFARQCKGQAVSFS